MRASPNFIRHKHHTLTRARTQVAARLLNSQSSAVYRSTARVTGFQPPPFDSESGGVKLEFLFLELGLVDARA